MTHLNFGKFAALAISAGLIAFITASERAQAQAPSQQYSSAQIQAGYKVYSSTCSLCHGGNGDSINGVNLSRQQFKRASTDDDIKNTIMNGVPAAGMPSFNMTPAELNGIVA